MANEVAGSSGQFKAAAEFAAPLKEAGVRIGLAGSTLSVWLPHADRFGYDALNAVRGVLGPNLDQQARFHSAWPSESGSHLQLEIAAVAKLNQSTAGALQQVLLREHRTASQFEPRQIAANLTQNLGIKISPPGRGMEPEGAVHEFYINSGPLGRKQAEDAARRINLLFKAARIPVTAQAGYVFASPSQVKYMGIPDKNFSVYRVELEFPHQQHQPVVAATQAKPLTLQRIIASAEQATMHVVNNPPPQPAAQRLKGAIRSLMVDKLKLI